jgi:hypothetical protein
MIFRRARIQRPQVPQVAQAPEIITDDMFTNGMRKLLKIAYKDWYRNGSKNALHGTRSIGLDVERARGTVVGTEGYPFDKYKEDVRKLHDLGLVTLDVPRFYEVFRISSKGIEYMREQRARQAVVARAARR